MRLVTVVAMIGLYTLPAQAEVPCFRSVAEAALQAGVRDAAGFRVLDARRDAFSGVSWATVVSCAHPERPGVLVRGLAGARHVAGAVLVMAGNDVRVVRVEASMRIELVGTALANGALGERVRVKLRGGLNETQDRFVAGLVRADGTLELED